MACKPRGERSRDLAPNKVFEGISSGIIDIVYRFLCDRSVRFGNIIMIKSVE